jgi:hypothetical protein
MRSYALKNVHKSCKTKITQIQYFKNVLTVATFNSS